MLEPKRKIVLVGGMHRTDQLQALADFYKVELTPMAHKENIGAISPASTAIDILLSKFAKSANKIKEVLERVREGLFTPTPNSVSIKLKAAIQSIQFTTSDEFQNLRSFE
jgi:hypothetical protein